MTAGGPDERPPEDPDEISQGRDRVPFWGRLPHRLRLGAVVLAVAVAAAAIAVEVGRSRPPGGSAGRSPGSTRTATPGAAPATFAVGALCPPVTDHATTLLLSFTLVNLTAAPVTVVRIEPYLPLQGLDTVSINIAGGGCDEHHAAPAGLEVPPGQSLRVTFRLLLRPTCPQPLPVQARVDVRTSAQDVVTEIVPVYADLGSIAFNTCPSAGG